VPSPSPALPIDDTLSLAAPSTISSRPSRPLPTDSPPARLHRLCWSEMESPGGYPESPLDQDDVVYPCKGCGEILEEGKAFELGMHSSSRHGG
jgi:hypothetical protein